MIATGLLWYDDDTRRPLAAKIADAAQRFRERVGYEPTTCQLNPTLAQQATAQREQPKRRSRRMAEEPVVEVHVRLEPSESLRPNYFFVGVQEGDKLKRVRGWQSPDQIEDRPGVRSGKARRSTPATVAKQATPAKTTRSTRQHTDPAATPAPVAEISAPVATAPKPAAKTIPAPVAVKGVSVAVASAPVAETNALVAAKTTRKASKPRAPAAAVPAPTPKIAAVAPTPEHAGKAAKRTRKMKNAATPATETGASVAAQGPAHAPKARPQKAAEGAPAPKKSVVVTDRRASDRPLRVRKTKNAATPATALAPAPVAQPVVQPTPRSRRPAATSTRPAATSSRASGAVAGAAGPALAAQTSLWGDLPPSSPSRKRKSA